MLLFLRQIKSKVQDYPYGDDLHCRGISQPVERSLHLPVDAAQSFPHHLVLVFKLVILNNVSIDKIDSINIIDSIDIIDSINLRDILSN